jgi:hypothetical protein
MVNRGASTHGHQDICSSVGNWLAKTGYPLELRSSALLRKLGYHSLKSFLYSDTDTETPREIDILASHSATNQGHMVNVELVCECKKSDKPFVMLCDKTDRPDNWYPSGVMMTDPETMLFLLAGVRECPDGRNDPHMGFDTFSLFRTGEFTRGYSLVQAFSTSDSEAYGACVALAKAHKMRVDANKRIRRWDLKKRAVYMFTYVIPVLIIDGGLLAAQVDEHGNSSVSTIECGVLKLRTPWGIDNENSCEVIVVAESFLSELAERGKRFGNAIGVHLPEFIALKDKTWFIPDDIPKTKETTGKRSSRRKG